MKSETHYLMNP